MRDKRDDINRYKLVHLFLLQIDTPEKLRISEDYLDDITDHLEFYREAKKYLIDKGVNLEGLL